MSLPSSPLLPRQSYMMPLRPSKRSPGTVCNYSIFELFYMIPGVVSVLPLVKTLSEQNTSVLEMF